MITVLFFVFLKPESRKCHRVGMSHRRLKFTVNKPLLMISTMYRGHIYIYIIDTAGSIDDAFSLWESLFCSVADCHALIKKKVSLRLSDPKYCTLIFC